MMNEQAPGIDVVVVGGGLAGLTAAAFLARAGKSVTLFEKSQRLGGRAETQMREGFYFNQGAHALYRLGAGAKILDELGITFTGGVPASNGWGVKRGKLHKLPADPLSLLTTRALGWLDKVELARLLATFHQIDPQPLQGVSVNQWLQRRVRRFEVRPLLRTFVRLFTYGNDPDRQSAGAAIERMQLALASGGNVWYIDGGWQTLVEGLFNVARGAGATIKTGARVAAVARDGAGVRGVRLADGTFWPAQAVIVTGSPAAAHALVERSQETVLQTWLNSARPVLVACLDVGLRYLPQPRLLFAVGIDQPVYFSVHSGVAQLAPADGAVIHTMKYLDSEQPAAGVGTERQLEALLDLVQPGWRDALVERRYLPQMTVANGVVTAAQGGTLGRPGPAVPGISNLYVAGDWVGPEEMLSDASFASAKEAARMVVAAQNTAQPTPAIMAEA